MKLNVARKLDSVIEARIGEITSTINASLRETFDVAGVVPLSKIVERQAKVPSMITDFTTLATIRTKLRNKIAEANQYGVSDLVTEQKMLNAVRATLRSILSTSASGEYQSPSEIVETVQRIEDRIRNHVSGVPLNTRIQIMALSPEDQEDIRLHLMSVDVRLAKIAEQLILSGSTRNIHLEDADIDLIKQLVPNSLALLSTD